MAPQPPPNQRQPPSQRQSRSQAPTHINLNFRDMHGNELHFKLKQTTAMKKAMTAYAARTEREKHTLRFVNPDGNRILDDQTPEMLELEDGDTIDVFMEVRGGHA